MKSCISTYSFHRLYGDSFSVFDAIDKTAELGCEGVELLRDDTAPDGYTLLSYARALTERARDRGLEVPMYTTGANFFVPDPAAEVERLKKHIDLAAECGIKLLRHDVAWAYYPGYDGVRTYKAVINYVAPYISRVADYAKSVGVKTCTENHGRLIQDSQRMLELFTAVNNTNYGLLCDMANFGGVDENSVNAVSALLDLIVHVHAKDVFVRSGMSYDPGEGFNRSRGGNYRRSTIFGHGDIATFQILSAIKASGYDGYVSLEFEGMEDVMTAVTIGTHNIQRMIKDLESK